MKGQALMLDTLKELIARQFEAALCTLNACIEQCPADAWDAPIANLAFCQAAFHALFYADCYLGLNTEALRQQVFHRDNPEFFRDYEELEDRKQQQMYDRESILAYMAFCRRKASEVIAAETAETLQARCGFDWLPFSRAELHVYNIRHIQHHAAQLILRLRLSHDLDIPWARSGWRP
jgi:hypothetical protein